jgi:hypothetical protein
MFTCINIKLILGSLHYYILQVIFVRREQNYLSLIEVEGILKCFYLKLKLQVKNVIASCTGR